MHKDIKNRKIFYIVLSLVTLVTISIGSTFSYFSASKTNTGTAISGTTNNISASSLTITTARVNLSPSPAPASDNLVPADFGVTPANMTTTTVNRALTAKCVNAGYTGCHVWKISATSNQTVTSANIRLNLSLSNVTYKNDWAYVVYTGTDTSASTIVEKGTIVSAFPNSANTIDINNNAGLTANTAKVYYLMVYLNNTTSSQNAGTTDGRGSYNGSVTLDVMGNEITSYLYDVLPTGYTRLNYIQGTGTQYIKTAIPISKYVKAELDAQYTASTSNSQVLFCSQSATGNWFGQINYTYGIGADINSQVSSLLRKNIILEYASNTLTLTVDGVSGSKTRSSPSTGDYYQIFGYNGSYCSKAKLYSCKVWENDTLIAHFVPCKNASNAIGLCDILHDGTFYANSGTGTFSGA